MIPHQQIGQILTGDVHKFLVAHFQQMIIQITQILIGRIRPEHGVMIVQEAAVQDQPTLSGRNPVEIGDREQAQ